MSPLRGIKVLDLTRFLPGPLSTLLLAKLGAQVDKIEGPDGRDYLRPSTPGGAAMQATFRLLNADKRSACIDLKKPEAAATLLRIVQHYDVIIEQFRPGVMHRLGLGHDVLLAHNPGLIVCAITGYGQDGPLATHAGHDINYVARAGVLGLQGTGLEAARPLGFPLADISGALWCTLGVCAALAERARNGSGRFLDLSLTEAAMPFSMIALAQTALDPAARTHRLAGALAAYNVYATKDGKYVALGALEPKFWRAFAEGVGLSIAASDLELGEHQIDLKKRLVEIFRSRTRAEWEDFGDKHECCLDPVLAPEELKSDVQHMARGLFTDEGGENSWPHFPFCDERSQSAAPEHGEHTATILHECGIDDVAYARLREQGVVR